MRYPLEQIKYYEIGNDNIKARIMNYGCTLLNLWVTMPDGSIRDIVLGYEDIADYFDNPPCFGSCVLPNANRIEGASFTLNDKTYSLDKNDGANNLHSGNEPLHKRLWGVETHDEASVSFVIGCAHMDCGMPGNREFTVTYSIEDNRLRIDYTCISDADTLFNPTNHSYFNLLGHNQGSVLEHKLLINADTFTPSDEHSICHGDMVNVKDTPMDFTMASIVGSRINEEYDQLKWGNGYDHNYILNDNCSKPSDDSLDVPASTLIAPDDSLTLNIYTTTPCMQVYTGNYLSDSDIGKGGFHYAAGYGIALETQYAPNAVNIASFKQPILKANTMGTSISIYEII